MGGVFELAARGLPEKGSTDALGRGRGLDVPPNETLGLPLTTGKGLGDDAVTREGSGLGLLLKMDVDSCIGRGGGGGRTIVGGVDVLLLVLVSEFKGNYDIIKLSHIIH